MKTLKGSKVAIIGAGAVGATIAFALSFQQLCSELVLIDVNVDKAQGEVLVGQFLFAGPAVGHQCAAPRDAVVQARRLRSVSSPN